MGANVVATGSGVINLTELTFIEFSIGVTPHIQANFGQMGRLLIPAVVEMGTTSRVEEEVY
jgi:hypothetical protein